MLLTPTHRKPITISPLIGVDYPRGFATVNGESILVYLGHPESRCVDCEFPLGNERRHPVDESGLTVLHGGQRMKFIEE